MEEFKLEQALGDYVIIEPAEKSSVLKAEEISTVFKVVSIGRKFTMNADVISQSGYKDKECSYFAKHFLIDDLVIVVPNTVQRTLMGSKEVYYVLADYIIATVSKNG